MTTPIPQTTTLYAIGYAADDVDLLLVVGWQPINDASDRAPVLLQLATSCPLTRTRFATFSRPGVNDVYDQILYRDDRFEARQDYALAVKARREKAATSMGHGPTQDHCPAAASPTQGVAA